MAELDPGAAFEPGGFKIIVWDRQNTGDTNYRRETETLPDIHQRHRVQSQFRITQPVRATNPNAFEASIDQPGGRLHQDAKGDTNRDSADQHRKEDDRTKQGLEAKGRSEQEGEGKRNNDLEAAGDNGIDDRVNKPG